MWQVAVTAKSHTKTGFYYSFTNDVFQYESVHNAFPTRITMRRTLCQLFWELCNLPDFTFSLQRYSCGTFYGVLLVAPCHAAEHLRKQPLQKETRGTYLGLNKSWETGEKLLGLFVLQVWQFPNFQGCTSISGQENDLHLQNCCNRCLRIRTSHTP